jgi:dienelactone hydrolase
MSSGVEPNAVAARKTATLLALGLLTLTSLAALTGDATAELVTGQVSYEADGIRMNGFVTYDDENEGRKPGVLVVHEWWGANSYARNRAEMLGRAGITALAVDMYGDGKTADHPSQAREFSAAVMRDPAGAKARFEAAMGVLKSHPHVDPDRIAAIGYCFGGSVVLDMARSGMPLAGVVSFHGGLTTKHPAQPGAVKARVLVLNGEADTLVSKESIETFKKEMDAAKVKYDFVNYSGAKHGFTNPDADEVGKKFDLPLAYDEQADFESWGRMQAFFASIFEKSE